MLSIPMYIKSFFEFWEYAKNGYTIVSKLPKIKPGVHCYSDFNKLSEDFFCEKLSDGDIIELSGFLSNFQYCYEPYTQNPYVFETIKGPMSIDKNNPPAFWKATNNFQHSVGIKKNSVFRYNPKYMGEEGMKTIEATLKPPLLSVTRIPSISLTNTEIIYPTYLYPSNSEGFMVSMSNSNNHEYIIPNSSLGIPLIINNREVIERFKESHVKIYGVIKEIPTDILLSLSNFNTTFKDTLSKLYYRPYRFYNKGFCIIVDEVASVENDYEINDRNMRLYIEGHFENDKLEHINSLYDDMDYLMQIFHANFDGPITNSKSEDMLSISVNNELFIARTFYPKLQNKNTHYCMSKFPNIANHNLKKYKSIAGIFNL